ncbi:MAG: phasin family protein [Novosphingobium sp.]
MTEKTEIEAEAAAQKAYAAAAEAQTAKPPVDPVPAPVAMLAPITTPAPVAAPVVAETAAPEMVFPSKAKRAPQPKADVPAVVAPVAVKPAAAPAPTAKSALLKTSSLKTPALDAGTVRRAPAKKAFKKAVAVKPVVQPKLALPKISPTAPKAKITPQPEAAAPTIAAPKTVFQQLKDKTMETTEFTTKIKTAVTEAQTKAKDAFGKGAATFGEYSEFSKGNLDAVVSSGKILASGMQSLGTTLVADGKTAFETLTAEFKELAAVKSPADFFKLQAAFMRRNFETAVANTSKNSEAVVKLANEVAAPISARVSLAVEKVKKAA